MASTPLAPEESGSFLLLEERFDSEDPGFLDTLRKTTAVRRLAAFADRWKKDPRPWARQQIFAYLGLPLACRGHNALVKRLFKHAEKQGDHELMAAFLVAFDRLVRREIKTQRRYERGRVIEQQVLAVPLRRVIPPDGVRRHINPLTGRIERYPVRLAQGAQIYTHTTRYYLRRRAWRYFRRLGFQRPAEYPQAVARALERYRDEDLARGQNMLDSWGLMHACFGRHPALQFGTAHIRVTPRRSLSELTPAPSFPELWKQPSSAEVLLGLLVRAQARLGQVFAMGLLRSEHAEALARCPSESLLGLLEHESPEVQQFGGELLLQMSGLEHLPLEFWLRILRTTNLTALEVISEVLRRHVTPERLELGQCLELACAEPVPVARLGLECLKAKQVDTPEDRALVAAVQPRCSAVAGELMAWALGIVGASGVYDRELVMGFFDSPMPEVRGAAWNWLAAGSAAREDAGLFSRLLETPFDDLRLRLVDELERRARLPETGVEDLVGLWSSVLLGVHRGGRQKQKAVRQIGQVLEQDPSHAEALLPVLAAAVRSVRLPEVRAALGAVIRAAQKRPELEAALARHLPELELAPREGA